MRDFLKHPLIEKLSQYGLPPDDFAIFGSGPLMAHGIQESSDLDLVARGRALEMASAAGKMGETAKGDPVIRLAGGEIEVFDSWAPGEWQIDDLIDSADIVEGLRFVSLSEVRNWKQASGRPKDVVHLRKIGEHLSGSDKAECPVCDPTDVD